MTHCNTPQHTATHCNTLQHTATHCNTLQHTATHCNTLQQLDSDVDVSARYDPLYSLHYVCTKCGWGRVWGTCVLRVFWCVFYVYFKCVLVCFTRLLRVFKVCFNMCFYYLVMWWDNLCVFYMYCSCVYVCTYGKHTCDVVDDVIRSTIWIMFVQNVDEIVNEVRVFCVCFACVFMCALRVICMCFYYIMMLWDVSCVFYTCFSCVFMYVLRVM